ncbi:hypothetical protein [Streptomyces hokutonensis]|uniref:hypothetical protein n=1 Tax=Streptomyces hokutonensis TaxID=1306990 RepID=UPI00369D61C4
MHYIGMTALTIRLNGHTTIDESTSNLGFLMVMLAGPLVVLLVATTIVMFDPDMLDAEGDVDWAAHAPRDLCDAQRNQGTHGRPGPRRSRGSPGHGGDRSRGGRQGPREPRVSAFAG